MGDATQRQWTAEEKLQILDEARKTGQTVAEQFPHGRARPAPTHPSPGGSPLALRHAASPIAASGHASALPIPRS